MEITFNKKYQILFKDDPKIFFFFLYSGRAAGKSFAISTYLAVRLLQGKGNCVFCRQYMANVGTSIIPEFLDKIKMLGISSLLKVYKDHIVCTSNGNELWFKGLQTAEGTAEASLKGIPKLACVIIDEMQEVKQEAFDRLIGTVRDKGLNLKVICALNPTSIELWVYKRFFRGLPQNFNGIIDNKCYIYSSYLDNSKYLAESYLKQIENVKKEDPIKYQNQYLGKWLKSNYNALWTKEILSHAHEDVQPQEYYDKIVIGVDPAVTAKKDSDTTAISVCAYKDNMYYILECIDGKWLPNQWALKVFELYNNYNADVIVAQANQGGDMVQSNIRNVCGDNVLIELVHASKGKIIRAEPIAALYQQHLVKHLKYFEQLEYEYLTFTGDPKDKSPNCLDSAVWGLTYIAQNNLSDSSSYI